MTGPSTAGRAGSSGCAQFDSDDDEIHLRTKVDKVARPLAARVPEEAAGIIERDGREKRDAGRNVPEAESDLGRGCEKILLRVARATPNAASVEAGVEPPTRRSCAPLVSSTSDSNTRPMSDRITRPFEMAALHCTLTVSAQLMRSEVSSARQPISETLERPESSTIRSASPRRKPHRRVPAGRHLLAVDHRIRRDRRAVERGRLGQALRRQLLPRRAKLFVAPPIGLGNFLLGRDHHVSRSEMLSADRKMRLDRFSRLAVDRQDVLRTGGERDHQIHLGAQADIAAGHRPRRRGEAKGAARRPREYS